VSSSPRSPSEHYVEAERALAAAESSVAEQMQNSAALIAIAHAILTLSPRRARRGPDASSPQSGGSPQQRWLRGDDQ
jgi:hypothetical protein